MLVQERSSYVGAPHTVVIVLSRRCIMSAPRSSSTTQLTVVTPANQSALLVRCTTVTMRALDLGILLLLCTGTQGSVGKAIKSANALKESTG